MILQHNFKLNELNIVLLALNFLLKTFLINQLYLQLLVFFVDLPNFAFIRVRASLSNVLSQKIELNFNQHFSFLTQ